MTEPRPNKALAEIEAAAERLATTQPEGQPEALEQLALTILEHHDHPYDSTATSELFSRELPMEVQRFAAVWLVRILTKSSMALDFENTERLAGSLFDQVFQQDVYDEIDIRSGTQTFQKLSFLADHLQSTLAEVDGLIQVDLDLHQLNSLHQNLMRLFNKKAAQPFLWILLPRPLTHRNRISNLFKPVRDYADNADNTDAGPIHLHDNACRACDEFESEARAYGTADADRILGGLARQMKAVVTKHFNSLEASQKPSLTFSQIEKKYPLERPDTNIVFKIKITNDGTGPARDLRLDAVDADDCLKVQTAPVDELGVQTAPVELGTMPAGDSFVLDIISTVVESSTQATLLAELSWARPGRRDKKTLEFMVEAQRDDVDWEELTNPYSTDPVTTGDDLVGRRAELNKLTRLANQETVGSGFIYGQKRVGKTSLANAIKATLESSSGEKYVVIKEDIYSYSDAGSSLENLGNTLVRAMKHRIPDLENVPSPDFKHGLAPLSGFIDQALFSNDVRILFILDEFDELHHDLFGRTNLGASLFQPLRQISSKPGCGFLLVGGENMKQIMNLQGDRLNRFIPIELDYFSQSNKRSDFFELIRRPVQDWLTISDDALDKLFEYSAGNPFFAKLIAWHLFSNMVKNRYSDASEFDMVNAIEDALEESIDALSFTHFWTDGLFGESDNAEQIGIIRRCVLIAAGRAFRGHSSANAEAIWAGFKNVAGISVSEQIFRSHLQDFVRRKVFVEDTRGNITPKIRLFRSWLIDKGIGDMKFCKSLDHFRFRSRAIELPAVREWIEQFSVRQDQRLMFQLLSGVMVYDEHSVRAKMREAFGIVTRNILTVIKPGARVRRDILVSSLDDSAAKSGLTYCRLFADENGIAARSVQSLDRLSRRLTGNNQIQRLVLIDDFSGTGQTLVDGLRRNLDLLQHANAEGVRIILIAAVGFAQARDRIERFIERSGLEADVHFCDTLGREHQAFSESSAIFPDSAERESAKQVAEAKGIMLVGKHPLGYGGAQATVVFYQSCPNNTLPILWSRSKDWTPLFSRFPA